MAEPFVRFAPRRGRHAQHLAHGRIVVGDVFHPIPVRIQSQPHDAQDKDLPKVHLPAGRQVPVIPVACLPARILASSNAKISAPPSADRGHRKTGRVVIGVHVDETGVLSQIVDAVRIGARHRRSGKIVAGHSFRRAFPSPLLARIVEMADEFLFLGIHGNDGLSLPQGQLHLSVDVPELRVPIRMPGPFLGLPVALQAVIHLPQQLRHFFVADGVSAAGQFVRQGSGAFAGPAQRRFGVSPRQRLDQGFHPG
jgi:hypothetical protein